MDAERTYDLAVIGGGINGAGVARDAAGRGFSVVLCEQDDLAQHTSSASTKLIHGGLRYLERGEFGLVRKALREREVLLRAAPHLIRPLRFILPVAAGIGRPRWMIRAGLFLYDHLARRDLLPASSAVKLREDAAAAVLRPEFTLGFAYWDAWVDDARLVVSNALDAAERGAEILTRTRCIGAERGAAVWRLLMRQQSGGEFEIEARAVVNAAGPWVARVLDDTLRVASRRIRLVKGSHIVVPALFDHGSAYIFQNSTGASLSLFLTKANSPFSARPTSSIPTRSIRQTSTSPRPRSTTCATWPAGTFLVRSLPTRSSTRIQGFGRCSKTRQARRRP